MEAHISLMRWLATFRTPVEHFSNFPAPTRNLAPDAPAALPSLLGQKYYTSSISAGALAGSHP